MFPVTIARSAVEAARTKLDARGGSGAVRLAIRGAGCSGFSYHISFDDDPPKATDHVASVDGVAFYVDKKSAVLLSGSTLNWVKHGIVSSGFEFDNPNVESSCGCGTSFSVK